MFNPSTTQFLGPSIPSDLSKYFLASLLLALISTGSALALTDPEHLDGDFPWGGQTVMSGDGKWIVWVIDDAFSAELRLRNLDADEQSNLNFRVTTGDVGLRLGGDKYPSLSADGSRIVLLDTVLNEQFL